jgi:hypothetical protein
MKVTLQRSRGLLLYLLLLHGLAGTLLVLLSINALLTAGLCMLLVLSLLLSCSRYGWLGGQAAICQCHCDGDGRWFLEGSNTQRGPWRLRRSVILGPVMLLNFKSSAINRQQSVPVFCDAIDADTWRQLCLKLRDPETWD